MSTKREFLTELVEENGLDIDEDIFKLPKGGKEIAIITRTGIEKIQYNNDIQVKLEAWTVSKDYACIKATATRDNYNGSIQTFGSAWHGQGGNCMSNYVAEMAEKRALARAVLKISGAYKYGVYAEDESDDFKRR
jgi:hypothetical protein|tara:strand:- start:6776 stop:7180 length:405 start_codon:yes stop_codon:yes gene_type:complete